VTLSLPTFKTSFADASFSFLFLLDMENEATAEKIKGKISVNGIISYIYLYNLNNHASNPKYCSKLYYQTQKWQMLKINSRALL
jgi:hypothetical protein